MSAEVERNNNERNQRNTENAKNVVHIVALLPEAGDSGSQESNVEDVADSMKKIIEPAGELEVEEDFESDEESEMTLPSTRKKEFPEWKENNFRNIAVMRLFILLSGMAIQL